MIRLHDWNATASSGPARTPPHSLAWLRFSVHTVPRGKNRLYTYHWLFKTLLEWLLQVRLLSAHYTLIHNFA